MTTYEIWMLVFYLYGVGIIIMFTIVYGTIVTDEISLDKTDTIDVTVLVLGSWVSIFGIGIAATVGHIRDKKIEKERRRFFIDELNNKIKNEKKRRKS